MIGREFPAVSAAVFLVAFALNWVWEVAHMAAYAGLGGMSATGRLLHCLAYALKDGLLIVGIYWGGALMLRDGRWIFRMTGRKSAAVVLIGAVAAAFIERAALAAGRWTYNEEMPRLPGLDVGLSPVVQMAVLPLLSFLLARYPARRMLRDRW